MAAKGARTTWAFPPSCLKSSVSRGLSGRASTATATPGAQQAREHRIRSRFPELTKSPCDRLSPLTPRPLRYKLCRPAPRGIPDRTNRIGCIFVCVGVCVCPVFVFPRPQPWPQRRRRLRPQHLTPTCQAVGVHNCSCRDASCVPLPPVHWSAFPRKEGDDSRASVAQTPPSRR